jgi:hypothetical protein
MAAAHSLAEEIADLVIARLRAEGIGGVYTSKTLPPGCPSREAFNDRCRFIDSAYLDGKVWVCPVDDYQAAMRRGSRPKARARKVERVAFDRVGALAAMSRTPKPKVKG